MTERSKEIVTHEQEFHAFDEDVRKALWGPLRKPIEGGGRKLDEGLVAQMQYIRDKEDSGGLRSRLATSDKVILAFILAVFEAVRFVMS